MSNAVANLQRKLGVPVTGTYDTATHNAVIERLLGNPPNVPVRLSEWEALIRGAFYKTVPLLEVDEVEEAALAFLARTLKPVVTAPVKPVVAPVKPVEKVATTGTATFTYTTPPVAKKVEAVVQDVPPAVVHTPPPVVTPEPVAPKPSVSELAVRETTILSSPELLRVAPKPVKTKPLPKAQPKKLPKKPVKKGKR